MPLFRSKFQPKKCPPRKASIVSNLRKNMDTVQLESEFQIQVNQVKLDLGDHLRFEFNSTDGKWTQLTNPGNSKSKSSTANQKLEAENNWLKIQADLLLNMLAETALEAHLKTTKTSHDVSESRASKRSSFKGRKLFP